VGNTAALVPLKVVAPSAWQGLVTAYERQNASQYLPASYTTEQIRGYEAQRALLADSFSHDDNAVLEIPFSGSTSFALVLIKPTSRGTILINPTNRYAEPILDYYSFSNPADVSNTVNSVRFTRRYHTESQTMVQTFNATELAPGTSISSDSDLERYLRSSTSSSTAHLSGTCALTPRSLGGVVGVDLTVYGVTGLSVADASIIPLIPAAHTCSTVYAVAEKVSQTSASSCPKQISNMNKGSGFYQIKTPLI
jgi:choline dehydrogenase-like flavoprotein